MKKYFTDYIFILFISLYLTIGNLDIPTLSIIKNFLIYIIIFSIFYLIYIFLFKYIKELKYLNIILNIIYIITIVLLKDTKDKQILFYISILITFISIIHTFICSFFIKKYFKFSFKCMLKNCSNYVNLILITIALDYILKYSYILSIDFHVDFFDLLIIIIIFHIYKSIKEIIHMK